MANTKILSAEQISQKLNRMAYEIYETNFKEKNIFIAGIDGNGYKVAERIAAILGTISPLNIKVGKITMDKENPWAAEPRVNFEEKDFNNKPVVLVDDVLNSGKTLIYAVKLFLDKPVKRLNTLVLVDRSHTRYAVKADFVGLSLSTTLQERIDTDFSKKGKEAVYLV
ncbi:MAG: phosphoribosyltransferase [Bacteroidetes bacterium]|nr:phosphoribosyltransferase [Bacteroidota bacterium]